MNPLIAQSLLHLFNRQERIMATLQELTDKLDALQVALDNEQAQVKAALDAQAALIAELQAQVNDGATPAQLQAIIDRISSIQTDLEGTITDAPSA